MRKKTLIAVVIVSLFGLGLQSCREKPRETVVYSVDKYDPSRNPSADLETTVKQAKQSGKRILLEVGGNWCSWCRALEDFIHTTPPVAAALRNSYVIMKVNMSDENRNRQFLERFPKIKGYPHIFVLDADGNLLHSQDTGPLEEAKSYNEKRFLDFLNQWTPKS